MRTAAGLTLLETTVAASLLGAVFVGVTQAMASTVEAGDMLAQGASRLADANAILHDIALELRAADRNFMYQTSGSVTEFSYVVCTGFDAAGNSIYDRGEFGRRLVYDRAAGTLTKVIISDAEPDREVVLSDQVAEGGFAVTQMGEDMTIYGNRLLLSLTLVDEDGEGRQQQNSAQRYVFIRSYVFGSDGDGGAAASTTAAETGTTGTTPTEPTTTEPTTGEPAAGGGTTQPPAETTPVETPPAPEPLPAVPEDLAEPHGPDIIWGNDQDASATGILLVVKLKTAGTTLNTGSVSVTFTSTVPPSLSITYGWQSNSYGLAADEIRIAGTTSGATAITVAASATKTTGRSSATGWTRETNWY